jgi:hypothetical protein
MAITTSAITSSFKNQLLEAKHDFNATGGDKFKLALYTDSSVIGPSLASFTTQVEEKFYKDKLTNYQVQQLL